MATITNNTKNSLFIDEPLVSVIMPAYNVEEYVFEAIQSILQQDYNNWELLIADDNSTDKTRSVISSFHDKRIKVFFNDYNLKQAKTRNMLFQRSRGEFITFLDSDDYCHPQRISKQVSAFLKDKELGMCGTWLYRVTSKGRIIKLREKNINHEEILEGMYKVNQISGATVMMKKEIFEFIGGYREYFEGACEDYDLLFRIVQNFKTITIPEPLYYYRMHNTSSSKEISAERLFKDELVRILATERKEKGSDMLMRRDFHSIDKLKEDFMVPFKKDPSLVYRDYAGRFLYSGLWWESVVASWFAVLNNPHLVLNYRTLFYCLRKFSAFRL